MGRDNRRARTPGVVRANRIGYVIRMCWGYGDPSRPGLPWYYRRHLRDGRIYTGPISEAR